MKKRYSEEQIIKNLEEAEAVMNVEELCRKLWDFQCNLLQLEGKIRGNERFRGKKAKGFRV